MQCFTTGNERAKILLGTPYSTKGISKGSVRVKR